MVIAKFLLTLNEFKDFCLITFHAIVPGSTRQPTIARVRMLFLLDIPCTVGWTVRSLIGWRYIKTLLL